MIQFIRIFVLSILLSACSTVPFISPPKQPIPPPQQQSNYQPQANIAYRVRKGDSLSLIAKRFRVSQNTIAQLNRLRPPYTIYVNQVLRIPAQSQRASNNSGQLKTVYRGKKTVGTPRTTYTGNAQCNPMPRWSWPTRGNIERTISQTGKGSGVNILGKLGQDIKAAAAGTVVFSGAGPKGYQNLIIIQHNKNLLSVYGHNRGLRVRKGQRVKAGQKIAQMGLDTQRRPVVHFEIRCHNKAVEPLIYLPK
ncbi:peptidoglycan DD-metalloendopeptidase family protein [Candidatus Albibeggiatoa sp. nov. NOAA]|uniref:peptidoglycan DD-metalloendopeptidase family protein n=1 Tax=Candidatus Albibeggiatoa sp. nov. NOAA TaxID=3162724 RepID=UPI0032F594B2|nr:peptidoglycan DD-metalloendopeptidase family protein [Thiotrichaceae bacterium]